MKEKIYTITVNEAFSEDCECPLCHLEKKLESDAVDYTLGAAMMEPDYRILSNELGFCRRHCSMLIRKQNKLSLSLVLDTHLDALRTKLKALDKSISSVSNEKSSFFKKCNRDSINNVTSALKTAENSCVICDKINKTAERYIDVIFYLWQNDSSFRQKLTNGKGFCLHHFNILLESAFSHLNHTQAAEFAKIIYDKECSELERIQDEIHRFTLKFDYRNKDMELGSAADAPRRTIEKISGFLADNE